MNLFGKQVFGRLREEEDVPLEKVKKNHRRVQSLNVYIKGISKPFEINFVREDYKIGQWRCDEASNLETFEIHLKTYLDARGTKGIRIEDTWYSPASIDKVELGKMSYQELTYNEES